MHSLDPGTNENKKMYTTPISYHPNLVPTIRNIQRKFGVVIPFKKPMNIIGILKRDRDPGKATGGVYKIPIMQDNKIYCYIGQTSRQLSTRIKEHKNSISKPYNNTSLKNFILDQKNVQPLWSETQLLAAPRNRIEVEWREAVEIFCQENTINNEPGRIISPRWKPLLEQKLPRRKKNQFMKFCENEDRVSSKALE